MRIFCSFLILGITLASCGGAGNRVYEQYKDFENGYWIVQDKPEFEFMITDASASYNLYADVRNSVSYPWSRFFMNYYLQDSTGIELQKNLALEFLFDATTGKPLGKSGLGDIYDHELLLVKEYKFARSGKYKMKFEQLMRMDTLQGILAVGFRVEKAKPEK
jgi:gliding motility-associated lipoprotein GldH